jgi:putative peptidoglycan lipid II flippase
VLLPTLSRLWQAGEKDAFRARLASALQPLIFLSLPTSVVLFAFRTSIVQTLFQTGAFSAESTTLVAAPLALLALGLISYAVVELLTRAFYAMHDTRTPVATGVAIIVINIAIGVLLLDRFGYLALAFALSASTTIEAAILTFVLRRRLEFIVPRLGAWLGRVLIATTVTAVISWVFSPMLSEITSPGNAPRLIQLALFAISLAVVGIVYLGCAWILRIPEICQIVDHAMALRSRLGRGLASARR